MAEAAGSGSKGAFAEWCAVVLHRARMARIPLEEAMGAIHPITGRPLVHEAFITVAKCGQGDGEAAGRIAVRLAKSLGQVWIARRVSRRGCAACGHDALHKPSVRPYRPRVTVGLFGLTSSFTGEGDATAG